MYHYLPTSKPTNAPYTHDTSTTLPQLQEQEKSGNRIIGVFAAASNINGLIADVTAIAILLHRYKALAVFDYATAAPYVKMDMNPAAVG